MADDDIDLDRVISDPAYRRRVIEYLNASADTGESEGSPAPRTGLASAVRAAAGPA